MAMSLFFHREVVIFPREGTTKNLTSEGMFMLVTVPFLCSESYIQTGIIPPGGMIHSSEAS
jgi:hypothetical protein